MENFFQEIRGQGYKLTPTIKAVLRLFWLEQRYLSPLEVHSMLSDLDRSAGVPTVYRILERLESAGILTTIKTADRQLYYYLCRNHNEKHHHHFICRNCRRVEEVVLCNFGMIATYIENNLNGKVESHLLQIEGLCQSCK